MNRAAFFAIIAGLCWITAVVQAAEFPAPQPPAPPMPALFPDPAQAKDQSALSAEDAFNKKFRELQIGHELRIAELLTIIDGRNTPIASNSPAVEAARMARNEALQRASAQAQDYIARRRTTTNGANPVDAPAQASSMDSLGAHNHLAVADCYRRLLLEKSSTDDLQAGVAALSTVDAAQLGEADLPTLFYLRTWFLAERARISTNAAEATSFREQASDSARLLLRDYPHSALARTAQDLVRDLSTIALPKP